MLEVCESDFSKGLADATTNESEAQEEYEKISQENKVSKASKEQDAKYKEKEANSLEENISEVTSDREGEQSELDAVLSYYDSLKPKCIAKPESYASKKARREAEIEGLKDALSILDTQASGFLQMRSHHNRIRVH